MTLLLTDAELHSLTGYTRFADQRRWLTEHGWHFEPAKSGRPGVGRAYADAKLGLTTSAVTGWKPNLAAISKAA